VPTGPIRSGYELSLTSAKSGALVGVLISVTTIPAAANAAVALAYWVPREAVGSATQLVINLSAIIVAGTLTLLVLRARTNDSLSGARRLAQPDETHDKVGGDDHKATGFPVWADS
jgi:uncharacterized membrane protein